MAVPSGPLHQLAFEYRLTTWEGERFIIRDVEFSETHIWGEYRLENGKVWRGIGAFRLDTSTVELSLS